MPLNTSPFGLQQYDPYGLRQPLQQPPMGPLDMGMQPPAPPQQMMELPDPQMGMDPAQGGYVPPAPEEAPGALAEAFPDSPIARFAQGRSGMGQPQQQQGGGLDPAAQQSFSPPAATPMPQAPQAPDLASMGGMTDDERLMYGGSVLGDIAEQFDRLHRRGKLSQWAVLQGQDVGPGGLDAGAKQLRQQLQAAPGQRQQAAIQQYGMDQMAYADQMKQAQGDPNSEASRGMQAGPMGQLLRQYGFDDRTIAMIPASAMQNVESAARAAYQVRQAQSQFDQEMARAKAKDRLGQKNWQREFDQQGVQFGIEAGQSDRRQDEVERSNRAGERIARDELGARQATAGRAQQMQGLFSQAMASGDPQVMRQYAALDPGGKNSNALLQEAQRLEQRNVSLGGAGPLPSATDQDITKGKEIQALHERALEQLGALKKSLSGYDMGGKAMDFVGGPFGFKTDEKTDITTRVNNLMAMINTMNAQGALGVEEAARMKETFGSPDQMLSTLLANPETAVKTLEEIFDSSRKTMLRAHQFDTGPAGAPSPAPGGEQPGTNGDVRVRLPDGRTGTVKASELQRFKRDHPGATEF